MEDSAAVQTDAGGEVDSEDAQSSGAVDVSSNGVSDGIQLPDPNGAMALLEIAVEPVVAAGYCIEVTVQASAALAEDLETILSSGGAGTFFSSPDCSAGSEIETLRIPLSLRMERAFFKPALAANDYVAQAQLKVLAAGQEFSANLEIRRAVKDITLGVGFGCSLLDDGSLWCWGGRDTAGTLEEQFAVVPRPTRVGDFSGSDVHSLTSDWEHACAIAAGGVICWGGFRLLGNDGAVKDVDRVVNPVGMKAGAGVTSIDAAYADTCAVKHGAVYCWGNESHNPVLVTGFDASDVVVEVAMGIDHRCARLQDGRVKCWGENGAGQLGDGSTVRSDVPVLVKLGDGVKASAIHARNYESCVVVEGSVRCWGAGRPRVPTVISGLDTDSKVSLLTMGSHHSCALIKGGEPTCWGVEEYTLGELGAGDVAVRGSPGLKPVGLVGPVSTIEAGDGATCAIIRGLAYCWGGNRTGELGASPDLRRFLLPSVVPALAGATVTQVSFGERHSCVVVNGKVSCWGQNFRAALGVGDGAPASASVEPRPVPGMADAGKMIGTLRSAQNGWTTCAIDENGQVHCWGMDFFDSELEQATPSPFPKFIKVSDLCLGRFHACALIEFPNPNPGVFCWGQNTAGQLGVTTLGEGSATPVRANTSEIPTAIACSERRTCAVVKGGVECWGTTENDETDKEPVAVGNLAQQPVNHAPIRQLAMASSKACALTTGGDVWCWRGQKAAVETSTGQGFDRIAGGSHETFCASAPTGLWCWGSNQEGQLGNGTTNHSIFPIIVTGVGVPVGAFATGVTTCAADPQGFKCWGSNLNRTLGGDAPYYRTRPFLTSAFHE